MKACYLLPFLFLFACKQAGDKSQNVPPPSETMKTIGVVEPLLPALDSIMASDASIEVLAEGYTWSEGPVWVAKGGYLLFTDVPENKIYRWKEGEGASLYLTPSGFTGEKTDSPEPGANGLTLDANGNLVMCQHGDRRVAKMEAPLDAPKPAFATLAEKWNGKRFNSPNDLVFDRAGNLYFTDPPYGLRLQTEDPAKEIPFQGVYRLNTNGSVDLLVDSLTRPNGIALSPDEKTLYVANSDPAKALWAAYDIQPDGKLSNGRIFHNATGMVGEENPGLPDGLKVDTKGNIFATGPGGVWVFSAKGEVLGRIRPGQATANCALDAQGGYLYLTSDMYLCRVKIK